MKERPILFQGAMVRALLDGTKTQTRRAVKGIALSWLDADLAPDFVALPENNACPYGQPGDRLWVRESFGEVYDWCEHPEMPGAPTERWHIEWKYMADGQVDRQSLGGAFTGWKPSIHMPRTACRIQLEIVSVRVERLNECSESDAMSEGVTFSDDPAYFWVEGKCLGMNARETYAELWESINGAGSWAANPWVWVVEFKRVTP